MGGLSWAKLRQHYPERIHEIQVDYQHGIDFVALSDFAQKMGIQEPSKVSFIIKNLYECFLQRDCSMIVVNPLVLTP